MPLLELSNVTGGYGPVRVLHGIDLSVEEGEVAVVLGANGAGKTTTLRAISGIIQSGGEITFNGERITKKHPEAVAKAGIAHVPQGRGTFAEFTVDENLRVGAVTRRDRDVGADLDRWYSTFPRLGERRDQAAGSMSGGEQQMLAIARALLSAPKLLILDEPTEGVAPVLIDRIEDALRLLFAEMRLGVLLIEQNLDFAFAMAQRGYVMEKGQIVLEAPITDLRHDAVERYLTF
jgi:branched-chain amino acid transport system ATP-binding protein